MQFTQITDMDQQDQQRNPPPGRAKQQETLIQQQPPPAQKCPRCDSSNTKFCYYNNYSLSQPRYFCKACRRYWTHGGTLRNVPIGGGCRKSKRPKPSTSGSSEIIPKTQNFSGMVNPGQGLRGLTTSVNPSMGNNNNNSFYAGGTFMSSMAAIQSLPNPASAPLNLGGGVNAYGVNMALLQGINGLTPMRPQAQQPFQTSNDFFPLIPQRPFSSWTQGFINRNMAATSSAATQGFWTGNNNVGDGENQASTSSFNPNQWSDINNNNNNNNSGFGPSQ